MNMTSLEKSTLPAHKVWVDLHTRITSQDLHFRSGSEETALASIVDVFKSTRALMSDNVGADEFLNLADVLLKTIRPYTARWHGLIDTNKRFIGPPARLQFRVELIDLRSRLGVLEPLFQSLSRGQVIQIPPLPRNRTASLGKPVPPGIGESVSRPKNAADINRYEHAHVAARRTRFTQKDEPLQDGTGLALSGGGIRSATFCLGVAQVLAEKKLLDRFDYLSTVSGGGYFGSFLSNQFTNTPPAVDSLATLLNPTTAESEPVRHLRNSSKYLLPKTTFQRLMLGGQLLSGMLTTTLLAAFVPVLAAFSLRLIVIHFFGFAEEVRGVFVGAALLAGLLAAACWLARPVKGLTASARTVLDMVSGFFAIVAIAALCVVFTWWATHYKPPGWREWHFAGFSVASLVTLISGALVVKAMRAAWKYRKALSRLFMLSGIVLFTIVYLWTVEALGLQPAGGWTPTGPEEWVFGVLVLWAIWALSINLNESGLHRYYRDRLAECYLDAQSQLRSVPNPPHLTELSPELPYHLINTTVNLTSSRSPELRGRGGDFFLLSKFFCGSPLMQYKPTTDVTGTNGDLDLATAMAISGAAASTNMGWQTMREYRTLMAIFNIRLGYWLKWQPNKSILTSNALVELVSEMIGRLEETTSSINLSDGGHIENLAAYELIRRKTRFIVCVDGGLDTQMTCSDLNRLQRLVAIDFGYHLDFEAAQLGLQPKYSSAYGVLVKIDYTPNEAVEDNKQLGWMLYIKLAMLGTEASYVLDYQRDNPVFPHQTTLDQFFDEAQFEAYRKLGETAARSFFAAPFGEPSTAAIDAGKGFEEWFQLLAQSMLRDSDLVFGP